MVMPLNSGQDISMSMETRSLGTTTTITIHDFRENGISTKCIHVRTQNLVQKIWKGFTEETYIIKNNIDIPKNIKTLCPANLLTCTGKGRISYRNGDTYEGELRDGVPHGKGRMYFFKGSVFREKINFDKDEIVSSYILQDCYDGSWVNGKKEGLGNYSWFNGQYYNGNWKNDCLQGVGELGLSNRDTFLGNFKEGQIEGEGALTSQGRKETGYFRIEHDPRGIYTLHKIPNPKNGS